MGNIFEVHKINYLKHLVAVRNLSDNSIRAYRHDLDMFSTFLDSENLKFDNHKYCFVFHLPILL